MCVGLLLLVMYDALHICLILVCI